MSSDSEKTKLNTDEEDLVFSRDAFESDSQLCIELINRLASLSSDDSNEDNTKSFELICERFDYLISKWQISPQHIESHLNRFLSLIIAIITESRVNGRQYHSCFKLITRLIACVGYKAVCRNFPTEVLWLTKVINWCELQNSEESDSWQTRYVLLLWLSMAVKTPFHLSKFDGDLKTNKDNTVMKRINALIDRYLNVGDKSRDSTAILVGNYYSRPELVDESLDEFVRQSIERISQLTSTLTPTRIQTHLGHVMAVGTLFKVADRKYMMKFAASIIETLINLDCCAHELLAKWRVKLIGRSALSLLTPRIAVWRYQRGKRLLAQNISHVDETNSMLVSNQTDINTVDDEYDDIPEEMELIFDCLLTSLRDNSTVVRYSAAKYVARITNRLPKELASDVVSHILQLREWRHSDSSWHGLCLALAEMCRRGLVLPNQLDEVVDVVNDALLFEEIRGSYSVGSHVRDSACYVCWSLARAYDSRDLVKHVQKLAPILLCVICFDREVNCRRAASAAVQELVGRTQIFPHGFDVVILTDFLSLANKSHCFLHIAVQLADKQEFGSYLVNNLIDKCDHWDQEIRELSAQSLGKLSVIVEMNEYLPKIVSKCSSIDLNSRHGSILAISEIVAALNEKVGNDVIKQIELIAIHLREKKLFRGIGGQFMKRAISVLIAKCSHVSLPIHSNREVLTLWTEIICESISSEDKMTRKESVNSIWIFCETYLSTDNYKDLKLYVLNQLKQYLMSTKESARIGASESLKLMTVNIIGDQSEDFLDIILSHINSCDSLCESRASEITTLVSMVTKFGLNDNLRERVFDAIRQSLNDRSRDSRGDIGGTVRVAAVEASLMFIDNCNEEQILEILKLLSTECVSQWKRGRDVASNAFKKIIYNYNVIALNCDKIRSIFDEFNCDNLLPFVKLLHISSFTYYLWRGFVTLIADPSETSVRHLIQNELKLSNTFDIFNQFVLLYENHLNCDRLSLCCIKCSHFLLISCGTDEHFRSKVLSLSWDSIRRSSDVRKLFTTIDVFCACIQVNSHVNQSLSYLTILLCHRFPRVRSQTASQTYVALMTVEDIDEQVLDLLTETDWLLAVDELRPIRDKICDLMGISKPKRAAIKSNILH